MNPADSTPPQEPTRPIAIGLTCWLWEWGRDRAMVRLAMRTGVTLQLTQKRHGLYRDIQGQVSGQNVDRFLGEFVRHF